MGLFLFGVCPLFYLLSMIIIIEKTAVYQEKEAMLLVHMFQSDIAAIVSENISDIDVLSLVKSNA